MITDNPDTGMIHILPNVKDSDALSEDIFTKIYLQYCKPIYNFIRFKLNNSHEAEELTSDIFEKVIAKYHTFNDKKGNFEVWIFSIAKNTLNDYFRKQYRNKSYLVENIEELPSHETDPQNMLSLDEETAEIIESLSVLNDKEKTIVSLKYGSRLKNKDIAKLMGLSEKNIGVILCRSIKKLRKKLESESDWKGRS